MIESIINARNDYDEDSLEDGEIVEFEVMPSFSKFYKTPENPIFEVFYVEEGNATLYSFSNAPKTIEL